MSPLSAWLGLEANLRSSALANGRMVVTVTPRFAALWLFVAVVAGNLTQDEMDKIVDLHNMFRALVQPTAADMRFMSWSEEATSVAESYAPQCIWDHNPELMGTMGENLFLISGRINVSKAITDWFNEYKHYGYEDDLCTENKMCGHYTQVVWAKSTGVGCASHLCETIEGLDWKNATILVCNYIPAGNVEDYKPYKAGEPCSECPDDMPFCREQLCDTEPLPDEPASDEPKTEPVGSVEIAASRTVVKLLLAGLLASFTI